MVLHDRVLAISTKVCGVYTVYPLTTNVSPHAQSAGSSVVQILVHGCQHSTLPLNLSEEAMQIVHHPGRRVEGHAGSVGNNLSYQSVPVTVAVSQRVLEM